MERFVWPADPTRKWFLILLWLLAILFVLGALTLKFGLHQKAWSDGAAAGFWATFGVMQWFFPEMSRLSTGGRRIFAVFLWAFSAFLLFF